MSFFLSHTIFVYVYQERSQKGDSGCASEKLGVPHLLSDECKKKKSMLIGY